MKRLFSSTRLVPVLLATTLVVLAIAIEPGSASARRSQPFQTAVVDHQPFAGPTADLAFGRVRAAGASAVRLYLAWGAVAPEQRPAGFDPTNPASPGYDWGYIDEMVTDAVTHGLRPILGIDQAPIWAQGAGAGRPGTINPNPDELGKFALAAARRYSGAYAGLPRVSDWLVWNEPNLTQSLNPQNESGRPVSPTIYRAMVNSAAASIHTVHRDNRVVAGLLAPFGGDTATGEVRPMKFMRDLLCMSAGRTPKPTCEATTQFDGWSVHPYTNGGPSTVTSLRDDLSIATLPRVVKLVRAAAKAGHVVSSQPLQFWVTEFSWDSKPPDPGGVSVKLLARWTSEAFFKMYNSGISLVTWFTLRDFPKGAAYHDSFQSGLYFRCEGGLQCDQPKYSLQAFRFPLVAYRSGGHVYVWCRTPGGVPSEVTIEQKVKRRWKRIGAARTNAFGVISKRFRGSNRGTIRGTVKGGARSVPFALNPKRDPAATPFG